MKKLGVLLSGATISLCGCGPTYSRNAVQSVVSPGGQIEAIVYETNGGATTSFGYEVDVRKIGDNAGVDVAELYGAVRNEGAYGVNLKWAAPDTLHVEYLRAKSIVRSQSSAMVEGKPVNISLDSDTSDPTAPSGGMLHNLHQK